MSRYSTQMTVLLAVRFKNWSVGIVNETGEIKMQLGRFKKLKFLKDKLLAVTDNRGKMSYIDLRSGKSYKQRPKVQIFRKSADAGG